MGVKKALYYGFNGYRVPTIPRAPRSIRKRGSRNKIAEDTKVNAFELLATIAGKLLQESESSSTSSNAATVNNQPTFGRDSIKHEQNYVDKPVKSECIHQERCEESVFVSGKVDGKSDAVLECTSKITGYNYSEKIYSDMKVVTGESRNASANIANKLERDSLDHLGDSHDINIVNFGRLPQCDGEDTGIFPVANTCSLTPTPTVTNVVRNLEFPLSKHTIPSASFSRRRNNVNLKNSDDDENFSRCFKLGTKTKTFRPPPRIGDRRIRKLLKSKYWKVAPKLKDCEASIADRGVMPVCRKRKTYHNQKIYQSDTSLKRKKLYDQNSAVTTDGGSSVESFSNLPKNNIYERKGGVSSSIMGHQASFHSRDSCVRLSIKSFRVPELYIEVPETATVGLLKRTVMEAVTAMLEGSLHVGVLVRGKKIRDDNRTLLQSGISHNGNLESLGFALEPSPAQDPLLTAEDAPFLLPCDEPQLQTRPQSTPTSDTLFSDVLPDPPVVNPFCTNMESNQDSFPSPANILTEKTVSDSRALVPVPAIGMEALAVSPINKKARGSELTQRRTRRPFSVSEVEALVQAVEELGTGRWRDVKLRAFEDANHRTYVDLKDKWKTLVHTARIAPQQRRGEPVPQQLLDRVLSAQAFWSLHHEKQHGKLHVGTLKLAEAEGEAEAEAETSGS